MEQNKLGFPLTYSKLHEYYDLLSASQNDIDAKNRFIDKVLARTK